MRVLVGCECSQTVAKAFRLTGCDAWSCDLQDSYGDIPQYHIKGDIRIIYDEFKPDLFIVHPPCTYLSNAGHCRTFPRSGVDYERLKKGLSAADFFFWCLSRPGRVCVENPIPMKYFNLPPPSQIIEPFYFGEPYTKCTYLWLRGLPPLAWSKLVRPSGGQWVNAVRSQNGRSKTFSGVAAAMAAAWSGEFDNFQLVGDWYE